jgi:hypothetical protein
MLPQQDVHHEQVLQDEQVEQDERLLALKLRLVGLVACP